MDWSGFRGGNTGNTAKGNGITSGFVREIIEIRTSYNTGLRETNDIGNLPNSNEHAFFSAHSQTKPSRGHMYGRQDIVEKILAV
jgi:hypothetical protein